MLCYLFVCAVGGLCRDLYFTQFCSSVVSCYLAGLGCVLSRVFYVPRCTLCLLGVSFSDIRFVWLGCDMADGLPGGIARLGARDLSSPLPLLRLRLPVVKVIWYVYYGCEWL